ncbi:uncharacterized protein BDW70DRAFT_151783 [Aspergillus foveolatus]|uniref:uncharacterized protein n=1 Tax=Aspergillus foveolatus TaxID=210207 RepID=UPI003CCE3C8F
MSTTIPLAKTQTIRSTLIQAISTATQISRVDSAIWAFLWTADIPNLEAMLDNARLNPRVVYRQLVDYHQARDAIRKWMVRTQFPGNEQHRVHRLKEKKSRPSSMSKERSANLDSVLSWNAGLCKTRDGNKCVITKANAHPHANPGNTGNDAGVKVAHIAPISLERGNCIKNAPFWNTLRLFFSDRKVDSWITATRVTTDTSNMICLSEGAAQALATARYALKPRSLNAKRTEMETEFFALPGGYHSGKRDIMAKPLFNTAGKNGEGVYVSVRLITQNSRVYELPSWEILELAWHMNRVAALSGIGNGYRPEKERRIVTVERMCARRRMLAFDLGDVRRDSRMKI